MSITDHAPDIAHKFDDCEDLECTDVLCKYYRAGLAAGHDFMESSAARFASVRSRGTDDGEQEP